MPFQLFGDSPDFFDFSRYAPPRSGRSSLTLADLYSPTAFPDYPQAPKAPKSFDELGPEAKRELRREAILKAAAALGAGGQTGSALAQAAAGVSDWKRERLSEEEARQQRDYGAKVRQAEVEAKRRQETGADETAKRRAEGLLKSVQAITEEDPELGGEAEAAALRGDFAGLRAIETELSRRRQARARGEDPSDPFADEREKAKIQSQAEKERAHFKSQEEIAQREALKEKGLLWEPPQYEPLGRVAERERMLQGIRLEFDKKKQAAGIGGGTTGKRIGQLPDGTWAVLHMADEQHPEAWTEPIKGQPPPKGKWHFSTVDGRTYVSDTDNPLAGAFEVPQHDIGSEEYDKGLGGLKRSGRATGLGDLVRPDAAPRERTSAQKLGDIEGVLGRRLTIEERKEAQVSLGRGTMPRDIVAQLQAKKALPAPEKAPTQGPAPKPKAPPSGPRKATAVLTEAEQYTIDAEAKRRWKTMPIEQKSFYGGYAEFLKSLFDKAAGQKGQV